MISWVDLTPTIMDFAGIESPVYENHIGITRLSDHMPAEHGFHGRSFLPVLEQEQPEGFDEIYASHTFHELQMYYPMRVVRDRKYKLIWNIAYGLPFPHSTDLWDSSTWQQVYAQGPDAMYGVRTVREYLHRPEFELYDMINDPWESNNLASDPEYAEILSEYKARLQDFQKRTLDPWFLKWSYQ
jgi:N-sulfoglucosamine sulfohydrolase